MAVSALGTLALVLICVSVFGGVALRLAGGLLALAGLLGLSLTGNANGLLVFDIGACLWLAGHLHFRLRHGALKSVLAEQLCLGAASLWRHGSAVARSDRPE